MNPITITTVSNESITSIPKDLHRHRNISVDSGIEVSDSSNSKWSDSTTETDLLQESRITDHGTKACHTEKSEMACSSSQSSDSDISRSMSQECNESVFSEKLGVTSTEGNQFTQLEGEDYPDGFDENVTSQVVKTFYHNLVEVIGNQVSVDQMETKLYSQSLIESTVHEEMRVEGKTDQTKTRRLLDAVMSKFRMSHTVEPFECFLEVLDSYSSCHDLVVEMKAEYRQQANEVSEHANEGQDPSQQSLSSSSSQDTSTKRDTTTLNPPKNPSCSHNSVSVSHLLTFYSPFCISLFLVISLLLIFSHLFVLHRALNQADMKKIEKIHPSSALSLIALYNEEKQQLEEQLLMARRQILQLNREVLDLKKPRNHLCTGANEPKITYEKQIEGLIEEKMDYVAKIENLTPQRNILLNGCNCIAQNIMSRSPYFV